MSPRRWPVLILAAACACSRSAPELPKEKRSAFQILSEGLVSDPPCSSRIPMEWSPSLPVPTLKEGRLLYRVFFRGWHGRPDTGLFLHDAEGDALFSAEGPILDCRQREKPGRAFADEPSTIKDQAEYDARLRALYLSIEEMGRLFAEGNALSTEEKIKTAVFAEEFDALSSPGHARSYRALSPDFWAWVKKNGGKVPSSR